VDAVSITIHSKPALTSKYPAGSAVPLLADRIGGHRTIRIEAG
jgi:hypothetical protein